MAPSSPAHSDFGRGRSPERATLTMSMLGPATAIKKHQVAVSSTSLPNKFHNEEVDVDAIPQVSLRGFSLYEEGQAPPLATELQSPAAAPKRAFPASPRNNESPSRMAKAPPTFLQQTISRVRRRVGGGGSDDVENQQPLEQPRLPFRGNADVPADGQTSRKPRRKIAGTDREWTAWLYFAHCITFYAPGVLLSRFCGMTNPKVRVAWREKMGLVSLIFAFCVLLAFFTFGFESITCGLGRVADRFNARNLHPRTVMIRGVVYDMSRFKHPGTTAKESVGGRDISWTFPVDPSTLPGGVSACAQVPGARSFNTSCIVDDVLGLKGYCHSASEYKEMLAKVRRIGQLRYDWSDVQKGNQFIVYNGQVLNLDRYFKDGNGFLGSPEFDQLLVDSLGKDVTHALSGNVEHQKKMACLLENFRVGVVQVESTACFLSQVGVAIGGFLGRIHTRRHLRTCHWW